MFRRTKTLTDALRPLARIADAFDANELDAEARKYWGANDEHINRTPPEQICLFEGRGGLSLLTLDDCIAARYAMRSALNIDRDAALEPMVRIARAWDANELDDEARKFYGPKLEFRTLTAPKDIALVTGRGGETLLTLEDAIAGRAARAEARHCHAKEAAL